MSARKFKVGDKVVTTAAVSPFPVGTIGTVVYVAADYSWPYEVDFGPLYADAGTGVFDDFELAEWKGKD